MPEKLSIHFFTGKLSLEASSLKHYLNVLYWHDFVIGGCALAGFYNNLQKVL